MPTITLIGAGSVIFAKTLVADILQNPALADSTLRLMDIDPARLRIAKILCERVVAQLGVKARIEATSDLRRACSGARYVICMIQVGGYRPGTILDFEIPKKYGLQQTIGDTMGVGGIFRGLRTIPELVKIARTLGEVGAPDPLLINYTNPMAMCMMGINQATGVPSVGLCHSVQNTSRQLALYAGISYDEVDFLVAGINHMAFFLKFRYRGQDAYPLLFQALDEPSIVSRDRVRFEMLRRLGYFVTESSEHFSEYCPYFIHHGREEIRKFDIPIDEYLRRCESIINTWEETERQMMDENRTVEITRSLEYGSAIINAVETNQPALIYGNVPNRNLITNLPTTASVEVPCLVDAQGLQPTVIGDLPPHLAALIRTNVNVQALTVEACMSRKREHIYHAVMMDPHAAATLKLDRIWAMTDELIAAHQDAGLLGDFLPTLPETGRSAVDVGRVLVSFEEVFSGERPTGSENELAVRARFDNRRATPFVGQVGFVVRQGDFDFVGGSECSLSLKPGEKAHQILRLRARRQTEPGGNVLKLGVVEENTEVLALDFVRPPRLCLPLRDSRTESVEIQFAGNRVAVGTLACDRETLRIDLIVEDTKPIFNPSSFWASSAIELFFMDPGRASGRIEYWIVIPDPLQPSLFRKGKENCAEIAARSVQVESEINRYRVTLQLSLTDMGLPAGEPFLFEFQVRASALGDAHGYTVQSWRGSKRPAQESLAFALIV